MNLSRMSVNEIQKLLRQRGPLLTEDEREALLNDARSGVRKLYQQFCRQEALARKENIRLQNMLLYEKEARNRGFSIIAGVDEAGRGPLAGPVVAAAVILSQEKFIYGIDDSKKLSPSKRDELYLEITRHAVCWSVGTADVAEIDNINILRASLLAMQRAVQSLRHSPDYILVDAVQIPGISASQLPVVKGDGKSISIAAASIIAKVTRDRMMDEFDKKYPQYGFTSHRGYATPEHLEALKHYGPCPLHRKTFLRKLQVAAVSETLW